ncbi:MAG: hypothetical protein KA174_00010 [Chitinophagales bacterium]|jgi:hypothetical protein|nr:hypothetical protein [Chitinophagales bacterium]
MRISKSTLFKILVCVLIIADIDFSYRQHEHKPLDGDLAAIIAPSKNYTTVLQEPFGFKAAFKQEKYSATNRFFSHAAMIFYYKNVYNIFSPLAKNKAKFIYVFTGIYQTIIQLLIVLLLSIYALRKIKWNKLSFLLMFLFLSAFMQTHGYYTSIGVIDQSISYTFFYAMPIAFLMIYFLPFLICRIENRSIFFSFVFFIVWSTFALVLSLTGPLISPIGVLISISIILSLFVKEYRIQSSSINNKNDFITRLKNLPFLTVSCLSIFILFCLYSQYVGTFNSENGEPTLLSFRYGKLIMRLKTYFTKDISFLLIVAVLAVNLFSLKNTNKQINREVKIISFLSVFYIFLLPLGGYRPYRPDIIRYDTFMPITIALLYLVGRSTFLASEIIQRKKLYYSFLTVIFAIFMYADKPQFNDNDCQYERMIELKNSKELITVFDNKCNLLTWSPLNDTAWTSQVSQMCYYWQITDKIKPFIINN